MNLGLKMNEIDDMDIGMMFDLIIAKSNMSARATKQSSNKVHIRKATQSDFDRF